MDKHFTGYVNSDRFLKYTAEQEVMQLTDENERLRDSHKQSQVINLILAAGFALAFIVDVALIMKGA